MSLTFDIKSVLTNKISKSNIRNKEYSNWLIIDIIL